MNKAVKVLAGLAVACLSTAMTAQADDTTVTLVRTLPRSEIAQGNLVHAGYLWVSVTSDQDGVKDKIFVYDADGKAEIKQIQLKHTASQIYAYSSSEILVIGRSQWPWKSHYTVIKAGSWAQSTYTFSEQYLMQEFAGNPQGLFFTETGNGAIYQKTASGIRTVASNVSGPGTMVLVGDQLWGIERRSFNMGDENLIRIGTRTGQVERLLRNGQGLGALAYHQSQNRVAVTEYLADKVHVINPQAGTDAEVAIPGGPWGMVPFGRCLAVATDREKSVQIVDLATEPYEVFARLDTSAGGELLKQPRHITVNPSTGVFFLRSAFPCPSCVPNTQSSVFRVEDTTGQVRQRCLAAR